MEKNFVLSHVNANLGTSRQASSTRHDVLTSESWTQQPPDEPIFQKDMRTRLGCLRCVFQRSRHQHVSGRPDILPFKDASSARHIFQTLAMPSVYFQIADGVPALVHANITSTDNHQPAGFQLVAHCVTKYGDWAMALSHNPTMRNTAVFWSVDKCIDSELLMADLKSLQDHAFHPMLLPCIMFAAMLRSGVERRLSIKEKLKTLEDNVRVMNRTASQLAHTELEVYPSSPLQLPGIEALFELLSTCRREQASREGRYEFWRSYHTALEDGFAYANEAMTYVPHAVFHKTHSELKQWTALSWCRFESLKARDIDHMARVDNVSDMVIICIITLHRAFPLTTSSCIISCNNEIATSRRASLERHSVIVKI